MEYRPFVVVVDDDASVRKALGRLLRTCRMDVEAHASGYEFLLAVKQRVPECLVLDIRMPGMTGPELRQRLFDAGYQIPIVFITAHDEEAAVDLWDAAGHVDVLLKPFDNKVLLDAIDRAMKRPGRS